LLKHGEFLGFRESLVYFQELKEKASLVSLKDLLWQLLNDLIISFWIQQAQTKANQLIGS